MDKFRPLLAVNRFWVARKPFVIGAVLLAAGAMLAGPATTLSSNWSVIQSYTKQRQDFERNLESLKQTQADLEKRLVVIDAERSQVVNEAAAQGLTEETIAYWRKQMMAFGMARKVAVTIQGRGKSSFKDAVRLDVLIASPEGKPLSVIAIAQALDFLQLYGYVEKFDGRLATLHVKGF